MLIKESTIAKKAVLFDFDGVLIDSIKVMECAWNDVQSLLPNKIDFVHYKKLIGIPFYDILERLKIPQSIHEDVKSKYSSISRSLSNEIELIPQAQYLIEKLKYKQIKIGLVTSKDKERTCELISRFNLNFDVVVTPELVFHGKPSPEPLLLASMMLNLNVEHCLFIGDMESDMKSASAVGMDYLHYLGGYQTITTESYGGVISSLLDIIEYLRL